MKTIILQISLVLLGLSAIGCNSISVIATKPDGSSITVKSTRVIWSTEAYSAQVTGLGSLTTSKSSVDAQAIGAAAEGVAKGLAASIKP